jgi:hypothetical protein
MLKRKKKKAEDGTVEGIQVKSDEGLSLGK